MLDTRLMGIDRDRFDPALMRATDDLMQVVVAAAEQGAERVEPSHVLLALARSESGVAAGHLARKGLSADVVAEAIRRDSPAATSGTPITGLDEDSVSDASAQLFRDADELAGSDGTIGEAQLLACTLRHLEPSVERLLSHYGGIDVAGWAAELLAEPAEPISPFAHEGDEVDLDAFTPNGRRVIETMAREASGLGLELLTTPLLLQAMAVLPGGLIESALHFAQHDVQRVRERLLALLGGRAERAAKDVALSRAGLDAGLTLVLERAGELAAENGGDRIGEHELLASMLENRIGVAAAFFRDADVDVDRLLRFARDYYREPEPEPEEEAEAGPLSLEEAADELRARVVGQPAAVQRLVKWVETIVRRRTVGWRSEEGPTAALLFCGPSGTGKTMTSRVLARVLYGSDDEVLRFDMGQFNSRESINNFVGAPPGYVGYGEGQLTNGLRDNPRRVLLFDEVEKADARVFDALLSLLGEGRITDPAGPVRDARESVIVMTTNLAAAELAGMSVPDDPKELREFHKRLRAVLGQFFRPEFLNRLKEAILFTSFDRDGLRALAASRLRVQAQKAQADLGVDLTWTPDVESHVVDHALDWHANEAARGVNLTVDELMDRELLRIVYEERIGGGTIERAAIAMADGELTVRKVDTVGTERP